MNANFKLNKNDTIKYLRILAVTLSALNHLLKINLLKNKKVV